MASKVTLMLVLLVVIFISNIEAGLRQNKYKKKDLSHLTKSMIQKLSAKPKQSGDKVVITRKPVNHPGKKKQITDDEGSNAAEDVSNDIDSNHSNDAHGGHKHHGNKDDENHDKKADSDDGNDDIDNGGDDNDDDENDTNNKEHDVKKKPHFVCLPGRTVLKASGGFHPNINPEPKPGPKPTPKPDGKSTPKPKPKPKETLNDSDEAEEPASDEDQMLRTHMNKGKKKEKSEESEADSEEEAEKKHKNKNKNRNKNKNKNGRGDEDDADADAKEDVFCQVCVCAVNGIDEYCSNRPALNVNECIRIAKINQERAKNLPFEVDRTLAYRIRRDLMWHKDDIPYSAKAHCVRGSSYYSNSVSANNTDIDVADDIDSLLDYSNEDVCFFCICSVGGDAAGCVHRDPWYCNYYRHYKSPNAIRDMYADLFHKDAPSYFQSLSYRVRRTMDRQVFELYDSVGLGIIDPSCVPFVSEHTDCTRENLCSGCFKCTCNANAQWDCEKVSICDSFDYNTNLQGISVEDLETAMKILKSAIVVKTKRPGTTKSKEDSVLGIYVDDRLYQNRRFRVRRTAETNATTPNNNTVTFYETIDELNEDTLKNVNDSGTIVAKKMEILKAVPNRRSGFDSTNINSSNSLLIQYSQSKVPSNPISDNKVDTGFHPDEKLEIHHDILSTNQSAKDTDLTKLVVNELSKGTETIGDEKAPVVSNITFTPENETLTAMTFIAGNLLSELWHMEKDASGESIETELMRHEKIKDLLELFREPLTLKQEAVLKIALEKLSNAMSSHDVKNISICEQMEEVKNQMTNMRASNIEESEKAVIKEVVKPNVTKVSVEEKLTSVFEMLGKFEQIRKVLHTLKSEKISPDSELTKPNGATKEPITVFGKLFEKVTKLLLPNKNGRRLVNKMKAQNVFRNNQDLSDKVKSLFGIDIDVKNLTEKDKIVLDYVRRMEKNPECLLGRQLAPLSPIQKMEGDILLNLSEFFKMKSFSDLVKLVQTEKPTTQPPTTTKLPETTKRLVEKYVSKEDFEPKLNRTRYNIQRSNKNIGYVKSKLKEHLVAVINDIIEMQNENQISVNDPKIAGALPCIYNLLDAEKNMEFTKKTYSTSKGQIFDEFKENSNEVFSRRRNTDVLKFIDDLKRDLIAAYNPNTRRRLDLNFQMPHSVRVMERLIQNTLSNLPKRRQFSDSIQSVKKLVESSEFQKSNIFQTLLTIDEVEPAKRLAVLKNVQTDVNTYNDILERIKSSSYLKSQELFDSQDDIVEFIFDAKSNLENDKKIIDKVNKTKAKKTFTSNLKTIPYPQKPTQLLMNNLPNISNKKLPKPQPTRRLAAVGKKNSFTRDEIATQLIKNRLNLYLKFKESTGVNLDFDTSYHIAKRILTNIDNGHLNIAKELFKVFLDRDQNEENLAAAIDNPLLTMKTAPRVPAVLTFKEPLIRFEEPKPSYDNAQWSYQEQLMKQLMNMKNI